jgi:hypothetical protein
VPKTKPEFFKHPNPQIPTVHGIKLKPGDVIQPSDLYASMTGGWEPAPCPGLTLQEGVDVIWVRPVPQPSGKTTEK